MNIYNTLKCTLILCCFIVYTGAIMTRQLKPIADTYLDKKYPNAIRGNLDTASVFQDLLQFGAESKLATTFNITSLYNNTIKGCSIVYQQTGVIDDELLGPFIIFNAYQLDPTWSETNATWNHPPALLYSTPIVSLWQDFELQKIVVPCFASLVTTVNAQAGLYSVLVESQGFPEVTVFTRECGVSALQPKMYVDIL